MTESRRPQPDSSRSDSSKSDSSKPGPLEGLRVLDLTRVLAGPTCTQVLGDLGAEVIKIERPGAGDDSRGMGPPYLKDKQGQETRESAYFLSANRNKLSVTVNLTAPEGRDLIRQLVGHCDILVENFRAGNLTQYGLDYQQLQPHHPGLIYCSVTGFGQTGPYAGRGGYDYLVQAMGGIMSVTGEPGGPPTRVGVGIADIVTGLYATIAILAALRHRDATGQGQQLDLALLDSQVSWLSYIGQNYLISGEVPGLLGHEHPSIVPYRVFEAKDGPMVLAAANDGQFKRFCQFAGRSELAEDKRFATNAARVRHRKVITPILEDILKRRTVAEWIDGLVGANVPASPINHLDQVFNDPQVRARGMTVSMNHPTDQDVDLIASPLHLSASPVSYRYPPPVLGEHTDHVLQNLLGLDEATCATLKSKGVI